MFDCQEMFRHACAFSVCAELATEKLRNDVIDFDLYASPEIVNAAFACEVFMKALLRFYDIPYKREHKIKNLFEILPSEMKDSLKSELKKCGGEAWLDLWGRENIENISNVFTEWRYLFEQDWSKNSSMHVDITFLLDLQSVLREMCSQLFFNSSWGEYLNKKRQSWGRV